ncbi:hypothetical protein [Streptomyces mirabilis]|uniref:hypothetical protein n=1 Tax=Streptomyces mirabilis TaxID=68239 RepID=UPI0036AB22E5
MSDLQELRALWAEFAARVAENEAPYARALYLVKTSGDAEMVLIEHDHTVRSAPHPLQARFAEEAASLDQQVLLLKTSLKDSTERGFAYGYLSPAALLAIRTQLLDAGLDAPEVDLWEAFKASDKKG